MANSSKTLNAPATDVFFTSAMSTLISGGIAVRNACGSTTRERFWVNDMPRDRAASACPTPTELMPERTASATKAEV